MTIVGREEDDGVRRNVPYGVRAKAVPTTASIIASSSSSGGAGGGAAAPQKTNIVYEADACSGPVRKDDFGRPKAVLVSNIERKENGMRSSQKPRTDVTRVCNARRPKQRNAFDEDQTIAAQAQAIQKADYRY